MTRITTSPTRIYRDRSSPVRMLSSSSHIYRRDVSSPVRVITSPARIVSIRVRPSVLSREYGRIEHKYRPSTARTNATEDYLNSSYSVVRHYLFQIIISTTSLNMSSICLMSCLLFLINVDLMLLINVTEL